MMDMQIANLINENLIKLDLESKQKSDVIVEIVELLFKAGKVMDKDSFIKSVSEREKLGSTGIGKGIAIPHGKSDVVTDVVIAFGRSCSGIDFDALDDKPVHLIFLLAAPKNVGGVYLKALSQLSRLLRQEDFRDELLKADDKKQIMDVLVRGDTGA
jgi:fructose-specific phosphotransferase system IIA component